jgi:alginate O-acetyltransferase complex protein AlgF
MNSRWSPVMLTSIAIIVGTINFCMADDGLYDPAPPANSAFLRIISAATAAVVDGAIAGEAVDFGEANVSSYVVVPGGKSAVEVGGASGEVDCPTGKYCSAVFDVAGDANPILIVDEILDNPAKSGLHFYNLTDQSELTLFAPEQAVEIFKSVPKGGMQFRKVGAVTVSFTVKSGSNEVAKIDNVPLKRRTGHSIIVRGTSGSIMANMVENSVSR